MNKRDTAYSAVKTFLVARGFSMEREDFEEFCTFVPAAGYSIGTVPAIKRLREITKGSVSSPSPSTMKATSRPTLWHVGSTNTTLRSTSA